GSSPRGRAAGRLPSCPRTSSVLASLSEECIEHTGWLRRRWHLLEDQRSGRRRRRPAKPPTPLEPREPALGILQSAGAGGDEARDRTPAVRDDDGLAVPHSVDEGAELVLGFGYCGLFHVARIARSPTWVNRPRARRPWGIATAGASDDGPGRRDRLGRPGAI